MKRGFTTSIKLFVMMRYKWHVYLNPEGKRYKNPKDEQKYKNIIQDM